MAIEIEEAKAFADLTGVKQDLEVALRFIDLLEAQFARPDCNSDLVQALTVAILIQYSRPFSKGYREWISESDLQKLGQADLELHMRYRDWRDKHIAHSVNPFEQNQVVARFVSERVDEEGVYGVSVQQHHLIGLSGPDLQNLKNLIAQVTAIVDERIEAERQQLLAIVQATPIQDILSGSSKSTHEPGMASVGKRRKAP